MANTATLPRSDVAPVEETSTVGLVTEVLDQARELVRIEVDLARNEIRQEVAQAIRAAIAFGIAAVSGVLVLCMIAMGVVLALGGTAIVAFVIGGVMLLVGVVAAFVGYGLLPRRPLEETKRRLVADVDRLKERIA